MVLRKDKVTHCLSSADQSLLLIPPHTTSFSRHAFSFTAPNIWNKLIETTIRCPGVQCTGCLQTPSYDISKITAQLTRVQILLCPKLPVPQIRDNSTLFMLFISFIIVLYC